jgi:hypothetical protein
MILQIVAIVLIILFLLIAAVLLIPFRVSTAGAIALSKTKFEARISWLGITFWRFKPRERPEKKIKPEEEKKPVKKPNLSKLVSLLLKSFPAIEILIRSIRRAIRIRKLSLDFDFGTGDPADTALLAGFLWSVGSILGSVFPAMNFSLRPDLQEVSLDGSVNADMTVRVGFVVAGFLRAYTKKPFRQLIYEVRTMR